MRGASGRSDDGAAMTVAERRPGRGARSARESGVMVVMEIDEAHAIDHRSCVRVLIMRCDTGFTMLSPAYQNPDRRGRARVTRGYRDDQG